MFYIVVTLCTIFTAASCYNIYKEEYENLTLPIKLQRIELEVTALLFWIMILSIIGNHLSMSILSNVSALLAAIVSMLILYKNYRLGDRKSFVGASRILFGIVVVYVFYYFMDSFHVL